MIGQSIPRKEDHRLLSGRGRFSADPSLDGQLYAAFLRSEHAHADVLTIDTSLAITQPGVIDILTGDDYLADGNTGLMHVRIFPITSTRHS